MRVARPIVPAAARLPRQPEDHFRSTAPLPERVFLFERCHSACPPARLRDLTVELVRRKLRAWTPCGLLPDLQGSVHGRAGGPTPQLPRPKRRDERQLVPPRQSGRTLPVLSHWTGRDRTDRILPVSRRGTV